MIADIIANYSIPIIVVAVLGHVRTMFPIHVVSKIRFQEFNTALFNRNQFDDKALGVVALKYELIILK